MTRGAVVFQVEEQEKGEAIMTETETFIFTKTKVLDIDTFETVKDEKTFDLETGKRVGFVRTVIYQDYSGKTSVSKEVIQ